MWCVGSELENGAFYSICKYTSQGQLRKQSEIEKMNIFSESELASSEEQWMHYLKSIDAYDLLGGNENLFMFWLEIQRKEPSLIRLFDLFLVNAIAEIHKLAADKELLIESRRLNKLQASKLYDEMNAFISDERERLNKEMTTQLLAKLQKEQREKEIDIQILQR